MIHRRSTGVKITEVKVIVGDERKEMESIAGVRGWGRGGDGGGVGGCWVGLGQNGKMGLM